MPALFNAYGIFLFRQFYGSFLGNWKKPPIWRGCRWREHICSIALPLSGPIIIPLTIGFFIANWNSYIWPSIITQDESALGRSAAIGQSVGGGYFTSLEFLLAAAVLAAIPTFILFFLAQRLLVEGIKMSGIKS